jgi:Ca2+-binding RTX toxin-like protein
MEARATTRSAEQEAQFTQEGNTVSDGSDVIEGDEGVDMVTYYNRSGNLTISLDDVANDGLAGENDNVKSDVEKISAGFGNDTITGSLADNTINGSGGNDIINGGLGDDFINGEANSDTITGGDGIDSMFGGTGADSFHALDGSADVVNGGIDAETDVVLDSDPFDSVTAVP